MPTTHEALSSLFSRTMIKTRKETPNRAVSVNHDLLIRGNFIRQEAAGIYTILPLGRRVLNNIENIIRHHLNELGSVELTLPALHPKNLWEQTGRWDTVDVLYKVQSKFGKKYVLAATTEEIATPLAKDHIKSYRDLPLSFYSINNKYRDEARAKSGIIRNREFGMKDMYSFHASPEDFAQYYKKVLETYMQIFADCGINAKITEASGGEYTVAATHEFMAISEAGEDEIICCEECSFAQNIEVSGYHEGDKCPKCGEKLKTEKAIEIGHIFDLGIKFSNDFNLKFVDRNGTLQPVFMGCYGIGTTRLMGAVVEIHYDERGIVWPEKLAPYNCHLVGLNMEDSNVNRVAFTLYEYLARKHISVLFDEREKVSPGRKFSDADLIGIPIRLIISKRTVQKNSIEITDRVSGKSEVIPLDKFYRQINQDNFESLK